jgi:hypothetical protein
MDFRRTRWPLVVLAILLNLGGYSASGAHAVGMRAPGAGAMAPDCTAHAQADDDRPAPAPSLPCCEGGDCHCAAPPAVAARVLFTAQPAPPAALPYFHAPPLPHRLLEDSLRPPIH